jgi:hypothetical protein
MKQPTPLRENSFDCLNFCFVLFSVCLLLFFACEGGASRSGGQVYYRRSIGLLNKSCVAANWRLQRGMGDFQVLINNGTKDFQDNTVLVWPNSQAEAMQLV